MKQLLLILSILLTCTAAQAQRYRVVAETSYSYSGGDTNGHVSKLVKYAYKKGSPRGCNYSCDTVNYDTMTVYSGDYGVLKFDSKKIRVYNDNGFVDTVYSFKSRGDSIVDDNFEVYRYHKNGKLQSIYKYGEISIAPDYKPFGDDNRLLPDWKSYGVRVARIDSFEYADDKLKRQLKFCLLRGCAFSAKFYQSVPDTLSVEEETVHTNYGALYEYSGRKTFLKNDPYTKTHKWYDKDDNLRSLSTYAIEDGALKLKDTATLTYNKDNRVEGFVTSYGFETRYTKIKWREDSSGRTVYETRSSYLEYEPIDDAKLTVIWYDYNELGKSTGVYQYEYYTTRHRKPAYGILSETSYTPFGYIKEYTFTIDPIDKASSITTRTTYTYEQY